MLYARSVMIGDESRMLLEERNDESAVIELGYS